MWKNKTKCANKRKSGLPQDHSYKGDRFNRGQNVSASKACQNSKLTTTGHKISGRPRGGYKEKEPLSKHKKMGNPPKSVNIAGDVRAWVARDNLSDKKNVGCLLGLPQPSIRKHNKHNIECGNMKNREKTNEQATRKNQIALGKKV